MPTRSVATSRAFGTDTQQVSLQIAPSSATPTSYYCELYEDSSGDALQLTYTYDGASFTHEGSVPVPMLAGSEFAMTYSQEQGVLACDAGVAGSPGDHRRHHPHRDHLANLVFIQAIDVDLEPRLLHPDPQRCVQLAAR